MFDAMFRDLQGLPIDQAQAALQPTQILTQDNIGSAKIKDGFWAEPADAAEQFKTLAGGLNVVHVPYRGSAPMMNDLIGGQISMAFDATPTALPQALSGTIRALGAGMAERMRALPTLATLQEQGLKGFECYTWNAILAPANTPQPFIARLNRAMNQALDDPQVFKRLQEVGVDPTPGSTPEDAVKFVKAELAKWAPIIQASGAQLD